jgi:hypothetical protein
MTVGDVHMHTTAPEPSSYVVAPYGWLPDIALVV